MDYARWAVLPAGRGGAYLDGDIIRTRSYTRPIYPFEIPNLPNALARRSSPDAALRFVEIYGLLGRDNLLPEEQRVGGDPVAWFVDQAATVRLVLSLIEALQEPGESRLRSILEPWRVSPPVEDAASGAVPKSAYAVAIGPRRELIVIGHQFDPPRAVVPSPVAEAAMLVSVLINRNTEGVRRVVMPGPPDGPFLQGFHARALVEVVWHHVGSMALAVHGGGGKMVRLCEECGTPFLVTDRRQRFCPPEYGSRQSLCGARARWRRLHGRRDKPHAQ